MCAPCGPSCAARPARGDGAPSSRLRPPRHPRRGSSRALRGRCARRRARRGAAAPTRSLRTSRPTRRPSPSPRRSPTAASRDRRTCGTCRTSAPTPRDRSCTRGARAPSARGSRRAASASPAGRRRPACARASTARKTSTRALVSAFPVRPVADLARHLDLFLFVRAGGPVAHEVRVKVAVDAGHPGLAVDVRRNAARGAAIVKRDERDRRRARGVRPLRLEGLDLGEALVRERDAQAPAVTAEAAIVADARVDRRMRAAAPPGRRRATWHAEQPEPLPWIASSRLTRRVPRWHPAQSLLR